jgi:hypothetical protein
MSCWVVPSLAAELWGITVCQVMERIRNGSVPSRLELGFTLVDVAPNSPRVLPLRMPPDQRPPTYVPAPFNDVKLSDEERQALLGEDEDEIEVGTLDWKPARIAASLLRRPPPRRAA